MLKDYQQHPDFTKYYNKETKANIWVLGYFGGGSINVSDAFTVAKHFAEENNVPLNTVRIDEIQESSRYKGFKMVFSPIDQEKSEDVEETNAKGDIFSWLTD